MMQSLLTKILSLFARLSIWRYRPLIIAITGNVGKSSTKEAIGAVLAQSFHTRTSSGNLNNDIGVPLNILGDWGREYYEDGSSIWFWFKVLLLAKIRLLWCRYPKVLVLEYAADRPGDISRLVERYTPSVSVVTAVGELPVHVEYFTDPDSVAKEKECLVRALEPGSLAVLNADDPAVLDMRERAKSQVKTFGRAESADMRISNIETSVDTIGRPLGVTFKLHYDRGFVPVKISGSLGIGQAYASAAAALVGLHLGMHLIDIIEGLARYHGMPGRLRILSGIRNSIIIDDTYNAAPAAMHLALDTLRDLTAARKVAVLGDMLELGKYAVEAHEAVGNKVGEIAQVLVCVGEKAKFIADAAQNQMPQGSIFTFHTSDEAKSKVQELIQEGDLVLVKGSQGKRMEKIVEEIMAEPEGKSELLVRQSKKWQNR